MTTQHTPATQSQAQARPKGNTIDPASFRLSAGGTVRLDDGGATNVDTLFRLYRSGWGYLGEPIVTGSPIPTNT